MYALPGPFGAGDKLRERKDSCIRLRKPIIHLYCGFVGEDGKRDGNTNDQQSAYFFLFITSLSDRQTGYKSPRRHLFAHLPAMTVPNRY